VPDTTLLGAVVAAYTVAMANGSSRRDFALPANSVIVNPKGPGNGPNLTPITDHIALEAIQ